MIVAVWLGTALEQRWGSALTVVFNDGYVHPPDGRFTLVGFTTSQPGLTGSHAMFNGWMTALCLMYAHQTVPGLNIKTQHLIWVLVVLDALALVFDGSYAGLMGLVGTGIAWVLVSGRWRPERIAHWWRKDSQPSKAFTISSD